LENCNVDHGRHDREGFLATSARRIEVFFYGLFMDVELLRTKGTNPVNIRSASVTGFSLRIGPRATLVPSPEDCAFGMLMQLTHDEVYLLYSDPSVKAYRPEPVEAQLNDGSRVPALCFNLPVAPSPKEANPDYATKLRELARQLSFPAHYIDSIH
jgi:hypothetical protein